MNPTVTYEMDYYIFEQKIIFILSRAETPCLKPVRIMVETLANLAGKYTQIYNFRKHTLLILLMPAFFFAKNQNFFAKIVPLLKAIVCFQLFSKSCVFSFCKIKGYY